jgi:tetratricopeptide (TPR) repeat protein
MICRKPILLINTLCTHSRIPRYLSTVPTLCEDHAQCKTGKPEIVVWDWNPLRPVRVLGQCRRSFLVGPEDGQRYAHTGSFPILTSLGVIDFDKSNEVLFRLGIIYKQQTKYEESLRCFDRILRNPPSPLANADIWFQIGHVYEQQGDVSVCLLYVGSI